MPNPITAERVEKTADDKTSNAIEAYVRVRAEGWVCDLPIARGRRRVYENFMVIQSGPMDPLTPPAPLKAAMQAFANFFLMGQATA